MRLIESAHRCSSAPCAKNEQVWKAHRCSSSLWVRMNKYGEVYD